MAGGKNKPCILCGNEAFHVCFADNGIQEMPAGQRAGSAGSTGPVRLIIFCCDQCGLAFLHPPHWKHPQSARRGTDIPTVTGALNDAACGCRAWRIVAAPEMGQDELKEIGQFSQPPGRLLNVGNDFTDILETARLFGWNSSTLNAPDLEEFAGRPQKAAPAATSQSYDVIRLENSLEKAENPKEYLEKVQKILNKNGLLVVTAPDSRGWDFPIYGQGLSLWPLDLPRWFFTAQTLTELLNVSGYKVLKVTTFETRYAFPPDFPALDPQISGEHEFGDFPPLSTHSFSGAKHLRVFARPERKGMFSSLWAEQQAYHPAEDFNAVLSFDDA
jgi:SAM-dependent methyltransferase